MFVSACGSDDAESPAQAGDTTELHDLLPESIRSEGQIDVISTFTYPPWHVVESDGTATGLNGDLAREMGERLGVTLHHNGVEYTSLIPSLLSGHADIIWDSLHDTKERQQQLDFLDFASVGSAFLVQKGNPADLSDMDSLCGNTVTLTQSQSQVTMVEEQQEACGAAGEEEIEILTLPNNAACVIAVQTGEADAFLNDKVALTEIVRTTSDDDLEVVSSDEAGFGASPVGIGVKKGQDELLGALQAGLQEMIDDGTYQSILEANGMAFAAVESAEINQAVS
jgi:polar amino acid transport system substrate-binding protein